MLKEGINDIINKQGSMYIQTWGRLKRVAINIEIFENLVAYQLSKVQLCTFVMFDIVSGEHICLTQSSDFPIQKKFSSFMMNKDAYISLASIDEMN